MIPKVHDEVFVVFNREFPSMFSVAGLCRVLNLSKHGYYVHDIKKSNFYWVKLKEIKHICDNDCDICEYKFLCWTE